MTPMTDAPPQLPAADRPTVVETYNLRKVYRTGFWLNQKVVSLHDCTLSI
ncbi:multidrug ABC transporter ATP-binding protein, partial [Leptolyngbya sp. FACHB-36]|nr:multidrug ABC transporter ATP-binding protein [Leptolyngbya sp. FACHB-36]